MVASAAGTGYLAEASAAGTGYLAVWKLSFSVDILKF